MPVEPALDDVRWGLENPDLAFDHVRDRLRVRSRRSHGVVHRELTGGPAETGPPLRAASKQSATFAHWREIRSLAEGE